MRFQWKDNKGEVIEGSISRARVSKDKSVTVDGFFNQEAYDSIRNRCNFHLTDEKINKPVVAKFDENKEYEIELQLNPEIAEEHHITDMNDSQEIMDYITENDTLHNQHNWYVLNVKQEEELPEFMKSMGSIKVGYSTTWNKELK